MKEIIVAIAVWLVLALLGGFIAWWLWGVIAVAVFGLPALTYWQIIGLIILLKILLPGSSGVRKSSDD